MGIHEYAARPAELGITHSPRTAGWLVLEADSVSYGKGTTYLPVTDLLRGYFRIEPRDDDPRIYEKVTGKLLTLDETLRPTLPAFMALLDVPDEDPTWRGLDPSQRRRQTLDAVKGLLLRESREQPLLLVFENLHWIDLESQALLDGLVASLPAARLLLLVNYRPEYSHGWGSKTHYTQLRLDPLPPESADDLLRGLLGDAAALEPVKRLLIGRTEGNPFFLEESIRTLVETGALVGERGAYRLARDAGELRVPATVQAVLVSRIDRLEPADKRLLQSAAVIGKDFPFALLRAISDLPGDELPRGLARLQAAELVYETALFPEPEYTFKHALTHEVAYGGLLQDRRRGLHARIVAAVEQLAGNRLAEHVEQLAHHALRGEVWDKARAYCRQAGAKAYARWACREAVGWFEQALVALEHLPESREVLEQGVDVRFDLRNALVPLGETGRVLDRLREAETIAKTLDDPLRLGRALAFLCRSYYAAGEHERAVAAGERALALGAVGADVGLRAVATTYLGLAHLGRTDYRRAVELLRSAIAVLTAEVAFERFGQINLPSTIARDFLAWSLAELGAFSEAIARAEEGIQIAETADVAASLMNAYAGVGRVYVGKGDVARATPLLEHALAICQNLDLSFYFSLVAEPLGSAYTLMGRVSEALPLLERAAEQAIAMEYVAHHARTVAMLGEAYLAAGRVRDAARDAARALELSREREQPGHQAYALRLLGAIAAQRDAPDAEQAEPHYRKALALAEELGMRPLQARCRLGLGELYRRIGRPAEARTELSTAVAMLREMGMAFWLPEAERELARSAIPPPGVQVG